MKRKPSFLHGYEYLRKVKQKLRDQYGLTARPGEPKDDPCFDYILDGEYPMEIDGDEDVVIVKNGRLSYHNHKKD